MKKTQTITKTSFKGLIDLQTQKLPQKKSRSRSIRDRNNTTSNQFSVSRTTEHHQSRTIHPQNRTRQGTWTAGNTHHQFNSYNNSNMRKPSEQGIVKFDDNLSSNMSRDSGNDYQNNESMNDVRKPDDRQNESRNDRHNESRNEGSMEKIRQNMRRQSQELKQRIRERSQSRRKRKQSGSQNSRNAHSREHSRQANKVMQQPQNEQQHHQQIQQKQAMNQIINMKNKLQALQYHYENFGRQLGNDKNKENFQMNRDASIRTQVNKEEELRERAQDLNNIIETFHITFKQNVSKAHQDINQQIEQFKNHHFSNNDLLNHPSNNNNSNTSQHDSLISIINKLQTQFCIQQPNESQKLMTNKQIPSANSSKSFLSMTREQNITGFSDLEKKLILAEERLLK